MQAQKPMNTAALLQVTLCLRYSFKIVFTVSAAVTQELLHVCDEYSTSSLRLNNPAYSLVLTYPLARASFLFQPQLNINEN